MATVKETDQRRVGDVAERAVKEVEGYVERIEKQTEKPQTDGALRPSPGVSTSSSVTRDDQGKSILQAVPKTTKPKIVLPLDEEEMKRGLHHKLFEAVRWLAEWCVYMIKKYPGRVFYRQKTGGEQ